MAYDVTRRVGYVADGPLIVYHRPVGPARVAGMRQVEHFVGEHLIDAIGAQSPTDNDLSKSRHR
jgi:hypothetical protein